MSEEQKALKDRLDFLECENTALRQKCFTLSWQYGEATMSLREMVELSLVAARQGALAAENAVVATRKAVLAAEQAAAHKAVVPVSIAVQAAAAAAAAAVESSVAAMHTVMIAANAATHVTEESAHNDLMQDISAAKAEANRALDDSLAAIKLAYEVAESLIVKFAKPMEDRLKQAV